MSVEGLTIPYVDVKGNTNSTYYVSGRDNVATSCTIVSGGTLRVHHNGTAKNTLVLSSGGLYCSNSGNTSNTIVKDGGKEQLWWYGFSNNTEVQSGGIQTVYDESIANNTIINENGQQIIDDGSAIGTVLSGGVQYVSHGVVEGTVISSGNQIIAENDYINVSNTNVYDKGSQTINASYFYSTCIVTGTTVHSGGLLNIYDASSITVSDITISAGGTLIDSGTAKISVNQAGLLSGVTYKNNALHIHPSMKANNYTQEGGYQYVYSGGTTSKALLTGNGNQYVLDGAITTQTILQNANQYVSSGGQASGTNISSGGVQVLYINGIAHDTVVHSGGREIVSNGYANGVVVKSEGVLDLRNENLTSATNIIVSAGGMIQNSSNTLIEVGSKGSLKNVSYKNAAFHVETGMSATRFTLTGAVQYVSSGAKTISATISGGGEQVVLYNGLTKNTLLTASAVQTVSGGSASNTHIQISGTQLVTTDGTATGTVISNGGIQIIQSGGKAQAFISSGGSQIVGQNGIANSSTVISTGGVQIVQNGGRGAGKIASGGSQIVEYNGIASATIVSSGGMLAFQSSPTESGNAMAKDITILAGGKIGAYVEGNASEQYIVEKKGKLSKIAFSNGKMQIGSSSVVKGVSLMNGAVQSVGNNGKTTGVVVRAGARQDVLKGGKAISTTVDGLGGSQAVSSGGTASSTIVLNNGVQLVNKKGVAIKTNVKEDGMLIVSNGGMATSAIIGSDGNVTVLAGGTLFAPVIKGGTLTLQNGSVLSGCVLGNAGTITVENAITLKGSNTFSKTTFENGSAMNVAKNGNLVLMGGVTLENMTLNANNATITVKGKENFVGKIKGNKSTKVIYDISSVAAKGTTTLLDSNLESPSAGGVGSYIVRTKAMQDIGTYELSTNIVMKKGTVITVKQGTATLGKAKVGGSALVKNGMKYKAANDDEGQLNLLISLDKGKTYKGSTKSETLTGTTKSEIFYGGKGNDTISGKNGHDVAVYDKTAWGKDVIEKTSGAMTLLFNGLKQSQITKKVQGSDLIISRKGVSNQTITVKNWSDDTHNIVFASNMTAWNKYVKAASPTAKQVTAAENEVWKKAGLAAS